MSQRANKRRRQQGHDFQGGEQSDAGDVVELPCLSFREPFCSLLLNNYKVLETRKWPVLAETKGPIGIHCAFHEWEGIEEAREYVRQQLGADEAAKALQMPSNMQRGAIVGVAHRLGRTWSIQERTAADPRAEDEEKHTAPTEEEAACAHPEEEEEEQWLRSVRAERERKEEEEEGRAPERECELVLCESCNGGGGGGEEGGGAEKRRASVPALERQALLTGLEGKCVTPVFGAAWLRGPVMMRGQGGLFSASIPRSLFAPRSLSLLEDPGAGCEQSASNVLPPNPVDEPRIATPQLLPASLGPDNEAALNVSLVPECDGGSFRLRESSLPLVGPSSPPLPSRPPSFDARHSQGLDEDQAQRGSPRYSPPPPLRHYSPASPPSSKNPPATDPNEQHAKSPR